MKVSNDKIVSLVSNKINSALWADVSVVSLLAANAVPLFGVLFLKWDAFYIVLLYWAENLVIGFYNILKIAFVKVAQPIENLGKLFMIPFFMIHYGGFTAIHGFFVLAIFGKDEHGAPVGNESWPCFFVFLQILLNIISYIIQIIPVAVKLAVLLLFVSHGVSFVYNYLYKGEYTRIKGQTLMGQPYARIFIMHIAIIFGGFLTMTLGSPAGLLIILIGLKTIIDVKMHLREHEKGKIIQVPQASISL